MALPPDTAERVRAALAGAEAVDHRYISVAVEGEAVILRGVVPTAPQAGVAATVAARHAVVVDNRLRVHPQPPRRATPAPGTGGGLRGSLSGPAAR